MEGTRLESDIFPLDKEKYPHIYRFWSESKPGPDFKFDSADQAITKMHDGALLVVYPLEFFQKQKENQAAASAICLLHERSQLLRYENLLNYEVMLRGGSYIALLAPKMDLTLEELLDTRFLHERLKRRLILELHAGLRQLRYLGFAHRGIAPNRIFMDADLTALKIGLTEDVSYIEERQLVKGRGDCIY